VSRRRTFGRLHRPGRGGVLLGVFVVALMGWITLNTVRSDSPGSQGLPEGARLPAFAVPLAGSACRGAWPSTFRPDLWLPRNPERRSS